MGENGKWQLAFWIITVTCGAWLGALSTNVIANDRIRVEEDSKIKDKIERLFQENSEQHMEIMGDLREIKAKMGIQHGKFN